MIFLLLIMVVFSGCNNTKLTKQPGKYDLTCKEIESNFYINNIRCENKEVFCYQVQGSGNFSCLKKQ